MENLILVRRIFQKDQTRFTIEWTDGKLCDYRLCDLQRLCPCARCRDEVTGRVLVDPTLISDELQAVKIVSVGRYALHIEFASGCSKGMYSYRFLLGLKNGLETF